MPRISIQFTSHLGNFMIERFVALDFAYSQPAFLPQTNFQRAVDYSKTDILTAKEHQMLVNGDT